MAELSRRLSHRSSFRLNASANKVTFCLLLIGIMFSTGLHPSDLHYPMDEQSLVTDHEPKFGFREDRQVEPLIKKSVSAALKNVRAAFGGIRSYGVLIMWDTDFYSNSEVEYGLTTSYGFSSGVKKDLVRGHIIDITGLQPNTKYHYRVKSADSDGQTHTSADHNFTTDVQGSSIPISAGHLISPQTLNTAGATYVLQGNVSAEESAFIIAADNITLDLNNYTITYDTYKNFPYPIGIPNSGFENGTGDVPSHWNLTNTTVSRRNSTQYIPFFDSWYYILGPKTGEEIVSDWTYLPASTKVRATLFLNDQPWTWPKPPTLSYKVERDNGTMIYSWTSNTTWPVANDFTTDSIIRKYRIRISMESYDGPPGPFGGNISFDHMDITSRSNYGIYSPGKNNIVIKNGFIEQGRANSSSGHGIFISGGNYNAVDNINVLTHGLEASGILAAYSKNITLLNCEVNTRPTVPTVVNRHQLSAAVHISGSTGGNIFNNTIKAGEAWGAIYSANENSTLAGNNLDTKTVVTNHHCIVLFKAHGTRVYNNDITADPGQGVLGSNTGNLAVFDNRIKLIGAQRPNLEYGKYSRDGIRINDYGSGQGKNVLIDGNNIYVKGDSDEYYLPGFPVDDTPNLNQYQVITGISLPTAGTNVTISNNNIMVNVTDPKGVLGVGIEPGSYPTGILFYNNSVTSNHIILGFGGYPGKVQNATFVSNTFIKGPNPVQSIAFHTIYSYRGAMIEYARFLNTTLKNGASLEPDLINIDSSTTSYILDIGWHLDLVIKDRFGFPIEDAQITVKDNFNNTVFSGSSDVHGQISKIVLIEKNYTGIAWNPTISVVKHTPHAIEVVKNGYETNITAFNMNASRKETIVMEGGLSLKITSPDLTETMEDEQYYVEYNVNKPDFGYLNWSLDTNGTWLEIDSSSGKLSGLPLNEHVGTYWVNISVRNSYGESDHSNFTLKVINVNDAPSWSDVPEDIIITKNKKYSFDVNATDIDSTDLLIYDIFSNPASSISIDNISGIINWTPQEAGNYQVNLSSTDGNVTIYHEYIIQVVENKLNQPPIIDQLTTEYCNEDEIYSRIINASDPDVGDILSWEMSTNATFLEFWKTNTTLFGIPGNSDVGSYWVNVTVTDIQEAFVFTNYTLVVLNINDPPLNNNFTYSIWIEDKNNVTFTANSAGDVDSLVLQYFWYFGDGSTAEGREVDHTYERINSSKHYMVILKIFDGELYSSTCSQLVNIEAFIEPLPPDEEEVVEEQEEENEEDVVDDGNDKKNNTIDGEDTRDDETTGATAAFFGQSAAIILIVIILIIIIMAYFLIKNKKEKEIKSDAESSEPENTQSTLSEQGELMEDITAAEDLSEDDELSE